MEKIALLCVTAVNNGNVELKVGVLPVRLAVTLHVLFPPLACFPFFVICITCSLKDGLPSSTMERTKKKEEASVFKIRLAGAASSRPADIQSPPLPPSCRRASQDLQVDNGSRMCSSSLKVQHFFFFCSLKSDRWGEKHFFCNYFHLSAAFSGDSLFPSFPVDITQAGGSRSRARLESSWGRFKSPLRSSIMTRTGPHVRKH